MMHAGRPENKRISSATARLRSLDVLRGIAIVLVFCRHLPEVPRMPFGATGFWHAIGWTGVDLFFVLSGFLIAGQLLRELHRVGRLSLKRFWIRRGLRIWPAYFAAYGLMIASRLVSEGRKAGYLRSLPCNVFFVQNYCVHWQWPHSWSLAVEEQFYFVFPLALAATAWARKKSPRPALSWVPIAALSVLILGVLLGIRRVLDGASWQDVYYPTHLRAAGLCVGVALAYLHCFHPTRLAVLGRYFPWLVIAGGLPLLLSWRFPFKTHPLTATCGIALLAVGFGAWLVAALHAPSGLSRKPGRWVGDGLAWCGVRSYCLYLAHSVALEIPAVHQWVKQTPEFWLAPVVLTIWVTGALVLFHLIERPFLRLRERWSPVVVTRRPPSCGNSAF